MRGKENKGQEKETFNSVLFVPATKGSALARRIKEAEVSNRQGRHSRIKVVERSGPTVKSKLSKKAPWGNKRCGAEDCMYCLTSKEATFSCRTPGVGYSITCELCSAGGLVSKYQGETGKNLYARGRMHIQEFKASTQSNCMVIHNRIFHPQLVCVPGDETFNFRMEMTGVFKTPLDRQVDEAMRIKNDKVDHIMNSGSEWRADSIPRAAFSAPGLDNRMEISQRKQQIGGGHKGARIPRIAVRNPIALGLIEDIE